MPPPARRGAGTGPGRRPHGRTRPKAAPRAVVDRSGIVIEHVRKAARVKSSRSTAARRTTTPSRGSSASIRAIVAAPTLSGSSSGWPPAAAASRSSRTRALPPTFDGEIQQVRRQAGSFSRGLRERHRVLARQSASSIRRWSWPSVFQAAGDVAAGDDHHPGRRFEVIARAVEQRNRGRIHQVYVLDSTSVGTTSARAQEANRRPRVAWPASSLCWQAAGPRRSAGSADAPEHQRDLSGSHGNSSGLAAGPARRRHRHQHDAPVGRHVRGRTARRSRSRETAYGV